MDDFVIAKDGTRIAYHIRGEGKNTIFLFNGFTCSEPNVKLLVNILSQKYRIVFWDYKGHGQSETPRNFKEVTVAGSVDDAKRVLDKLEIKEAIFLGYSTGVQIMFEFNFRYPEYAKALISISGFSDRVMDSFLNLDTTVFGQLGEAMKRLSPVLPHAFSNAWRWIHSLPFDLRLFIASKTFLNEEKTVKEDIQPFLDSMHKQDLNLLIHFIMDVQNHPLSKPLETIKLPFLIMAGGKDLFAPAKRSEEMHRKVSHSELLVISHASHNIIQEEADTLGERILTFLNKNGL
ncbi:MAG TPA: alpha/beta hydrolase [Leptospiraceae bacterium]|nr:alpha/beta hydrolase [Leptospiraceae bacterium]HMW04112.1 alpha/beta hydrolase [Leptospiraceae bacterium]HMX30821.1 alpha/beta hydrolase [Leptospiraceae bacterium]HMY30105.1 alpha/beta hydrolase [Leptospiraceae bacterium]HMZ65457.1 alpha/beta hydrolase [Leptospiraceae bacterium]